MTVIPRSGLVADLVALGIATGDVLLVHGSLSALGRVPGGEQAVVMAIRDVIGPEGTIVVPAQSWQLCDPAYLRIEPPEHWDQVRAELPAYDPRWTPTRSMGLIAEAVRTHPEAVRSSHPHRSFAAWGPAAEQVVAHHELDDPVGEGSPLRALYELSAMILFLGVGFDKCTALHLAESRSGLAISRVANGAPIRVGGARRWVSFSEPAVDDGDFTRIGADFTDAHPDQVRSGRVGAAESRLVSLPALVDFGASWMAQHRVAG
ncbi:MAG: AAC(3) family N-acetyltransferase [Acidimicrobiia bacterium]|nr:AAC(3) family N-acetyltransferase [Acidimicrobiia bacterium]